MGDHSDVYVIGIDGDLIQCVFCKFNNQDSMEFSTGEKAIAHLIKHNESGDNVPQYTIDEIAKDYGIKDIPKVTVYKKKKIKISRPPNLEIIIKLVRKNKTVWERGLGVYLVNAEEVPYKIESLLKAFSRTVTKSTGDIIRLAKLK